VVTTNLSSEDIHCKPIEAADDCLLNVETQAIQGCHCGQQDAWPTRTEHVDIDCMPLPHPDFNLRPTRLVYIIQCHADSYRCIEVLVCTILKKEVKDKETEQVTY